MRENRQLRRNLRGPGALFWPVDDQRAENTRQSEDLAQKYNLCCLETTGSQDEMKRRTFSHIFSSIDRTRFIWGGPLAPLSTGALLSHRDTAVFPTVLSDPPISSKNRDYVYLLLVPTVEFLAFSCFVLWIRQPASERWFYTSRCRSLCRNSKSSFWWRSKLGSEGTIWINQHNP